ncbi:DUF5518 domain-containing protein [Natrinema sp. 1APR25-10V2]|uniref:DUF5518 domain-containing protein n=1 Tax=Natrinema sp. 1APR25-10V2 TaxID=2951081 RepID=UPI0028751346|nr:DUF5518 domain-containing protein [Natrinema sp. 1APR25-10V2]MDS0476150.1 DUF5518 domain-containing protein [Natrinema sp. 1APR25-10V2]
MVRSRTAINAIIGAVVGVVLSFIPLSTVLGGAVAGFLEGPNQRDGTVAGALAGAIAFLPIAAAGVLAFGFLSLGLAADVPVSGIAFLSIVLVSGIFFLLLYTVGLSALGGYLGAYLAVEYPDRRQQTRETIGFETDTHTRTADAAPIRDRESESERGVEQEREWDR